MPNVPWGVVFNQLIADLKPLLDSYSLPDLTLDELWDYQWIIERVQGALMLLPTFPHFQYMSIPDKTHGEFLHYWQMLESMSDSWEQRIHFGRDRWHEDNIVVTKALKGIEGARPVGTTGERYTGQESHTAGQ